MASTIVSIINGRPAQGPAAGLAESPNPSRLADVVAEVTLADAATFAAACAAAKQAQPLWADIPAPVRGRVVAAIGRIVEANKQSLARLVTRELGKPYAEALGEVQEIIDTCDFFLGEGRRLYGQTVPSEMPDKQLFTFRVPVGTVAVVTAGNFPVAVPSWYVIPALVTGNTVVWKPAEYAAASAMALFELLQAAGLPEGVLNIVFADGPATFGGLEQALQAGHWTRSVSPAPPPSACASANSPAVTCRARASNSAARTRWSSHPMPTWSWPWKAPCSPASAPRGSGAPRLAR